MMVKSMKKYESLYLSLNTIYNYKRKLLEVIVEGENKLWKIEQILTIG